MGPMMGTILAGVDETPNGRDAATLACALAGPGDEILLARVRRDPLLPARQPLGEAQPGDAALDALAAELADGAPVRTCVVTARSAARALLELAAREQAQLIVLGSSRRWETDEAFAGRTARQVLHGAPHAVAIAPRGAHERGCALRTIVAGVDGSRESRAALALARRLADAAGAQLHVVAVADDTLPIARTPVGVVGTLTRWDEIVAAAREAARRLIAELTADGAVTGEVREGGAPEELAAAATEREADLLVVGSRHWGPTAAIAIGGTAEELLRGCPCPLLLVPRPALR